MAREGKTRMTFSERRTNFVQQKLINLRERVSNNPPRTVIGRELAKARLNRLQNIVERRILRNNIKVAEKTEQYQEYEEYYDAQEKLLDGVSALQYERENVLRQLQDLERFNPNSDEFMYAPQQRRVSRNMPRGYKPRENKNEESKIRSDVEEKRKSLEERLNEIDALIEEHENALKRNDKGYKESKREIKNKYREEMALVAPGPVTKIRNFIARKADQFRGWIEEKRAKREERRARREERRAESEEKLWDAVDKSEGASKRELFLRANAGDLSQEEQARLSEQIQGEIERKKAEQAQKGDEEPVVEEKGPEIVE